MTFAYPMQKLQDWLTQQWVIFRGRKINPEEVPWLMGPFGNLEAISPDFIRQFALKENLIVDKETNTRGLIPSMHGLNLPVAEFQQLSQDVIDFYERTTNYSLDFSVQWNPFFRIFGVLLNKLFSNRINQLNVPTKNNQNGQLLNSELLNLVDPETGQVRYTFWYRSVKASGQVIYSGVYGLSTLPSGKTCIKAVFPLPNGNATVLMTAAVGAKGELILDSSGKQFGDAGFYFLLKDAKGNYWSQFVRSFRDRLIVATAPDHISARQTLTLWHRKVLTFNYKIVRNRAMPEQQIDA